MCKQVGFELTETSGAMFPFMGENMSPLAKRNYKKYEKILHDEFVRFIPYFTEDDLIYYNKIYRKYGHDHHAIKHFSLLEYIIGFENSVGKYEFDYAFENVLNLFIFKYKAVFTTDHFSLYPTADEKERIKQAMVEIEEQVS